MHMLQRYIEEIYGLSNFVRTVAENPIIQGVVLDVNPIWLKAYILFQAGLNPDAYDHHRFFWSGWDLEQTFAMSYDIVDLSWKTTSIWVRHASDEAFDKPIPVDLLPFLVKVIARPIHAGEREIRNQLRELVQRQKFPAVIETRPVGALCLAPGDTCLTASSSGTIGGFLRDQNGTIYAATCGHVVPKGTPVNVNGSYLGNCSQSHAPVAMTANQVCTVGCPHANQLDLALIDVPSGSTVANTVTGVAATISCKQSILLRTSKLQAYEVGGLVLTYCTGNSKICFENMFEVRPVLSSQLNPKLAIALATVPTQGDSGAWVETAAGSEWCGVLVAADGLVGYALEADVVLEKANSKFGLTLQLA